MKTKTYKIQWQTQDAAQLLGYVTRPWKEHSAKTYSTKQDALEAINSIVNSAVDKHGIGECLSRTEAVEVLTKSLRVK